MFFLWIASSLFLYIASVMMFLNNRPIFAIILLLLGFLMTITFIFYYRKHKKRSRKQKKRETEEDYDESDFDTFLDCSLLFDCFDPRFFRRFGSSKNTSSSSTSDSASPAEANRFGGGKADNVGTGGSSSGSSRNGGLMDKFDCDCDFFDCNT